MLQNAINPDATVDDQMAIAGANNQNRADILTAKQTFATNGQLMCRRLNISWLWQTRTQR